MQSRNIFPAPKLLKLVIILLLICLLYFALRIQNSTQDLYTQLSYCAENNHTYAIKEKSIETLKGNAFDKDSDFRTAETKRKQWKKNYRQIMNTVKEFWFFARSGLNKTNGRHNQILNKTDVVPLTSQYTAFLINSITSLQDLSGMNSSSNEYLGDLVQARLKHIQNPPDCKTARKVSCQINWPCGFGCQLHHVTYCLLIAYATSRTLVLDSTDWNYNPKGWEDLFMPLSSTCTKDEEDDISYWPSENERQILKLKSQTYVLKRPMYLPRAVPQDLNQQLSHGEPIVWWIGQLVKYIFKPNQKFQQALDQHSANITFENPIVGVHIRRTDKINTEASFHSIKEYMQYVEEYYAQLSLSQTKVNVKRVYVATDDKTVIGEIKEKYPEYLVLGDVSIAGAASLKNRFSKSGLLGIATDLYFLSHTDYLVCTFSSQICRLAYELMNSKPVDASLNVQSLDDIYFFAGQIDNIQIAVLKHTPIESDQIELEIGDRIRPDGNHWNGYSIGTNLRTKKRGFYPSFKVVSHVETFPFPTYPEVKIT